MLASLKLKTPNIFMSESLREGKDKAEFAEQLRERERLCLEAPSNIIVCVGNHMISSAIVQFRINKYKERFVYTNVGRVALIF